jgi:cysteinyl-tRNA synthetase
MDDDFNTPKALATLIGFAREVEPHVSRQLSRSSLELIVQTFNYFGGVFGILQSTGTEQGKILDGLLDALVATRNEARKKGDWKSADEIRKRLSAVGITLEDTSSGTRWYLSSSRNSSG